MNPTRALSSIIRPLERAVKADANSSRVGSAAGAYPSSPAPAALTRTKAQHNADRMFCDAAIAVGPARAVTLLRRLIEGRTASLPQEQLRKMHRQAQALEREIEKRIEP